MATTEPTYIDFHFCAMVGIMLCPPEYGGGIFDNQTYDPDPKDMPQKLKEEQEYLLKSRSGKFVMNMYKQYRNRRVSE